MGEAVGVPEVRKLVEVVPVDVQVVEELEVVAVGMSMVEDQEKVVVQS